MIWVNAVFRKFNGPFGMDIEFSLYLLNIEK